MAEEKSSVPESVPSGKLGRIVNVVVLVTAVFLCATLVRIWIGGGLATKGDIAGHVFGSVSPAPIIGSSVSNVRPAGDRGGVILFLSGQCRFCRESLPFYNRLLGSVQRSKLSFLVAMPDSKPGIEQYIRMNGLTGMMAIDPRAIDYLNLDSTPRLMIYDDSGRIVGSWEGRLTGPKEQEVYAALHELAVF